MAGRSRIVMTIAALSLWYLPAATASAAPGASAVLNTYADIALAGYQDSLTTAKALDKAVKALIANPSVQRGRPHASPTSRRKCSVSATPLSTTGKAG